jgi:hypothetical protein
LPFEATVQDAVLASSWAAVGPVAALAGPEVAAIAAVAIRGSATAAIRVKGDRNFTAALPGEEEPACIDVYRRMPDANPRFTVRKSV